MSEPSLVVQGWLYTTLSAALTGLGVPVFDRVSIPASSPRRYVTIGEGQVVPTDEDDPCFDGHEVFATVQAWSDTPGYVDVKTIAAAIKAAVEVPPSLTGFSTDHVEVQSITYGRENDGLVSRAIITIRLLVHAGV